MSEYVVMKTPAGVPVADVVAALDALPEADKRTLGECADAWNALTGESYDVRDMMWDVACGLARVSVDELCAVFTDMATARRAAIAEGV